MTKPTERRPNRAVMMAELRRAGVEHSASMPSPEMHALFAALEGGEAVIGDPLDHDGDGEKGGSKPGAASTAAKGARRKVKRRGSAK